MSKKRILGFTLAIIIGSTSAIYADGFKDLDKAKWAEPSIQKMVEKGYVGGFPDGTFRPSASISRAEFMAIINKMNNFTEEADVEFKDVSKSHWAYNEIRKAVKAGYASGFPDGTFKPGAPVTREQAAAIISNLYEFENSANSVAIKDLSKISPWAADGVVKLLSNNIMSGYEDGSFGGKTPMNRAECIVVLDRVLTNKKDNTKVTNTQETKKTEETVVKKEEPKKTEENSSTGGGGGGGGGSSTGGNNSNKPSQEIIASLNNVASEIKSSVESKLKTKLQKETITIIVSSIEKYLNDYNYSISADVENAKSKASQMSESEYKEFKDIIKVNIPAKDLDVLNNFFGFVK